jgi:hypothetical protein
MMKRSCGLALVVALLAAPSWAQISDQPVTVQTGTQTFSGAVSSATLTTLTLRLARCTTATPTLWCDAATTVSVQIGVSYDGGSSWADSCGFTAVGGIHIKRDGSEATESAVQCRFAAAAGRQIRGEITVASGPLVTRLTLEAR